MKTELSLVAEHVNAFVFLLLMRRAACKQDSVLLRYDAEQKEGKFCGLF
jgi:hypothetical protein